MTDNDYICSASRASEAAAEAIKTARKAVEAAQMATRIAGDHTSGDWTYATIAWMEAARQLSEIDTGRVMGLVGAAEIIEAR